MTKDKTDREAQLLIEGRDWKRRLPIFRFEKLLKEREKAVVH